MSEPDDLAGLDELDVEALDGLTDEQLALALDALYGPDPLAGEATPVTRRRKPQARGRFVNDLPPL